MTKIVRGGPQVGGADRSGEATGSVGAGPPGTIDFVRIARETLTKPNRLVQLAWDTRDQLQLAIANPRSDRERYLADALAAGALTNERLQGLVDRWLPEQFGATAKELVAELLTRPQETLDAVFGAPPAAPPVASIVRTRGTPEAEATLAVGRDIANRLLDAALAGTLDPRARKLLEAVRGGAPFVLGTLAEALGTRSARAFFRTLERVDDATLASYTQFIATQTSVRRTHRHLAAEGASSGDLAAAAQDPSSVASVADYIERATTLLSAAVGLPYEDAAAQVHAETKAALEAASNTVAAFEASVDPTLAEAVRARLDPLATLMPAEAPSFYVAQRVRALNERLYEAALFVQADRWLDALAANPDARAAAGPLLALPAPARTAAAAELLQNYSGVAAKGEATDYLAAVLAATRGDGLAAVSERFLAELTDPAARTELAEFAKGHADAAALVGAEAAAAATRRAELDAQVLSMPIATYRTLVAHLERAHPHEGLGFLVSNGGELRFLGVDNVSDTPERRARPDGEQLARVLRQVERLGLDVVATVHSHPDKSGVFSDEDLEAARPNVALWPGYRSVIGEVRSNGDRLTTKLASFSSDLEGQVTGEDRVELTR